MSTSVPVTLPSHISDCVTISSVSVTTGSCAADRVAMATSTSTLAQTYVTRSVTRGSHPKRPTSEKDDSVRSGKKVKWSAQAPARRNDLCDAAVTSQSVAVKSHGARSAIKTSLGASVKSQVASVTSQGTAMKSQKTAVKSQAAAANMVKSQAVKAQEQDVKLRGLLSASSSLPSPVLQADVELELEIEFLKNHRCTKEVQQQLSQKLGISRQCVKAWFNTTQDLVRQHIRDGHRAQPGLPSWTSVKLRFITLSPVHPLVCAENYRMLVLQQEPHLTLLKEVTHRVISMSGVANTMVGGYNAVTDTAISADAVLQAFRVSAPSSRMTFSRSPQQASTVLTASCTACRPSPAQSAMPTVSMQPTVWPSPGPSTAPMWPIPAPSTVSVRPRCSPAQSMPLPTTAWPSHGPSTMPLRPRSAQSTPLRPTPLHPAAWPSSAQSTSLQHGPTETLAPGDYAQLQSASIAALRGYEPSPPTLTDYAQMPNSLWSTASQFQPIYTAAVTTPRVGLTRPTPCVTPGYMDCRAVSVARDSEGHAHRDRLSVWRPQACYLGPGIQQHSPPSEFSGQDNVHYSSRTTPPGDQHYSTAAPPGDYSQQYGTPPAVPPVDYCGQYGTTPPGDYSGQTGTLTAVPPRDSNRQYTTLTAMPPVEYGRQYSTATAVPPREYNRLYCTESPGDLNSMSNQTPSQYPGMNTSSCYPSRATSDQTYPSLWAPGYLATVAPSCDSTSQSVSCNQIDLTAEHSTGELLHISGSFSLAPLGYSCNISPVTVSTDSEEQQEETVDTTTSLVGIENK